MDRNERIGKLKIFGYYPLVVTICNLLLVMLLYTASRLFFYICNQDLFSASSGSHLLEMFQGGLRFDLTTVLYLSSLYIVMMLLPLPMSVRNAEWYQKTACWALWVPNLLGIVVNSIDLVYVRFTDRRITGAFFREFEHDTNLGSIFFQSAGQYWYVTLFALSLCALLILLTRRKAYFEQSNGTWVYVRDSLIFAVTIYFAVIGIRGGFGKYTRPITISNALQYTNSPLETTIVLNTPFSLIKTIGQTKYVNPNYYPHEQLEEIMSPIHKGQGFEQKRLGQTNVVILILESFSKEYIGYLNNNHGNANYVGYTPFLDSLLAHSYTYTHSYASGRKSIDAMPSILSSIPMLIEPYVVTQYATNEVSSLAQCLSAKGYSTAFFHGAPNGSMGFQAYARYAGFEHYFGMTEYDGQQAFDGTWAIWDEEFLQYFGRTMSGMQEPFLTTVFTASSHHPFRVPACYEGVFPMGTLPIHQCVGYTDNALRQFFAYAQTQSWYAHTLFVLTGDHTNALAYKSDQNARGLYEVPIAFYYPGIWEKGMLNDTSVISQVDIMPSVLAFLGYEDTYFSFGEDALMRAKEHNYAVCYNHPIYQILSDKWMVQFDGRLVTGIYDLKNDKQLNNNTLSYASKSEIQDMVWYLKGYIQQYISRMLENRLTISNNKN